MFMSFTTHAQNLVCSYSDWWSWLWCQRVLICNGQRVWTALTFCSWLWTWSGPGGWAGFSDNPGSRPKPDRPRKTPWTLQSYNSSYRFLSCCRKYIHCRVFFSYAVYIDFPVQVPGDSSTSISLFLYSKRKQWLAAPSSLPATPVLNMFTYRLFSFPLCMQTCPDLWWDQSL